MNITEMHVWFRQYAQQMGMQNVRAILPEQIDLLINTSITDIVNQLIKENIGVTNDRVITDNSKIGQINALRSLYKVIEIDATIQTTAAKGKPFVKGSETYIEKIYGYFSNFTTDNDGFKYLFLVDLSINYKNKGNGTTNYFPVRLIDDAYLSDTLNDFVLSPRVRTPIAVIYNDQLDVYLGVLTDGKLDQELTPNKLRVSYIGVPKKVAFLQDIGGTNVDCDLPEYMHIDILKHAVDLYRTAINGALYSSQQQEQAAQQENVRNNYRNEGNQ